jgi:hypothetical protein
VNRAYWNRTIHKDDGKTVISYTEGYLADDNFQTLVQGDGLARVKTLYQRAVAFHEEKITVEVEVACDQNEQAINRAGELTMKKAFELVQDGYGVLADQAEAAAQGQTR